LLHLHDTVCRKAAHIRLWQHLLAASQLLLAPAASQLLLAAELAAELRALDL